MKLTAKQAKELFPKLCVAAGLKAPAMEVRFHPTRKWRFDFCWIMSKVALEVEGGVWTKGRHTRGSGFLKDVEKYNEAVRMGWKLFRCTPSTLCSDATLKLLHEVLT